MSAHSDTETDLRRTPLYDAHCAAGAKMVAFAGYEMPVQYPLGVLKEHLWTREKAGLFDVSHMGQAILIANDARHETVARWFETLVPADILNLKRGQQRYTQLLNDDGGIIDDLMVTRPSEPSHEGGLVLIVNAGRKNADFCHIEARLPPGMRLEVRSRNALLALQGPAAASVLSKAQPRAAELAFMCAGLLRLNDIECLVSRSGYTGEDGFEIAAPSEQVTTLWEYLLTDKRVAPIGLGARDSLRLEAGLCLYGHDIDETTSPVEAGLAWSIQRRRREEGGFPGAERIMRELKDGPRRIRVGIRPEGRAPAREGTRIFSATDDIEVGHITSGSFGPSVGGPVAMGYVDITASQPGTPLTLGVRGRMLPARTAELPFVAHNYKRNA